MNRERVSLKPGASAAVLLATAGLLVGCGGGGSSVETSSGYPPPRVVTLIKPSEQAVEAYLARKRQIPIRSFRCPLPLDSLHRGLSETCDAAYARGREWLAQVRYVSKNGVEVVDFGPVG
jgi:hypothetical protein